MSYQYLKLIVSSLHIVMVLLSSYAIYLYSKNIIIDKAPTKGSILSVFNLKELREIGFYFFIVIINLSFLLNFYERISVYSYIIIFMLLCIGLISVIISKHKEVK